MPSGFKNRVDPWGRLHTHEHRSGTRMGNRGILHDAEQKVVRHSASTAWLCCRLSLNGIKRTIFQVDPKLSYSELFFLDEATALAAGHRPCNDCQPYRFKQFKAAWCRAHAPELKPSQLLVGAIDQQLKTERIDSSETKPSFRASPGELPAGTIYAVDSQAYLVTSGGHFVWSQDGYSPSELSLPKAVEVLTPPSIVAVLRSGYVPQMHPSADA